MRASESKRVLRDIQRGQPFCGDNFWTSARFRCVTQNGWLLLIKTPLSISARYSPFNEAATRDAPSCRKACLDGDRDA
jgi:hypothetical protein